MNESFWGLKSPSALLYLSWKLIYMRTRFLGTALFAFGTLAALPAWGSVDSAGKPRPLPSASVSPRLPQAEQFPLLAAPAFNPFSEIRLVAFDDKNDKKGPPPPPPPPPPRSEKCPPGHGGDDNGHGNDGHDCRVG